MNVPGEEAVAELDSLFFDLEFKKSKREVSPVLTLHPYSRGEWTLERDEVAQSILDVAALIRALQFPSKGHFIYTCSCGIAACGGWDSSTTTIAGNRLTIFNESMPSLSLDLAHVRNRLEQFQKLSSELARDEIAMATRAGTSPLIWAVATGNDFLAESLLLRGHDVDKRDKSGRTPLRHAVEAGSLQLSQLLIDSHATPELADVNGWTPLHESVERSSTELAALLLKSGCSPNVRDCLGDTPLHRAARGDEVVIASSLVRNGAVMLRNHAGSTPLDICEREGGYQPMRDVLARIDVGTQQGTV